MKVHTAMLPAGGQRPVPHAAFADHTPQAKIADDLPLVRFLPDGGGGPGCQDLPTALIILHDHRPAMIDDSILQTDSCRQLSSVMKVLVHRISASKENSANLNGIADLERAD